MIGKMLYESGAIKFGEFKLKSGMMSPFYISLRQTISHPRVFTGIINALAEKAQELDYDKIAGIAYAGIPLATGLGMTLNKPFLYTRNFMKQHGISKLVEGDYTKGEHVLVVDDLITTGESKFEAIQPLESEGLTVKDVLVLLDREQGGKEKLAQRDYKLHSAITASELFNELRDSSLIATSQFELCMDFIKGNKA